MVSSELLPFSSLARALCSSVAGWHPTRQLTLPVRSEAILPTASARTQLATQQVADLDPQPLHRQIDLRLRKEILHLFRLRSQSQRHELEFRLQRQQLRNQLS